MNRLLAIIILAAAAFGSVTQAEVYVYSNRVTFLSPSAHPLTFNTEWPARYTVFSRTASWAPSSFEPNHTIWWHIIDTRDGEEVTRFPVEIRDRADGHAVASVSFKGFEPGTYLGRMARYLNETNYDGLIAEDTIYLYTPCEGCGVSNSITIGSQTYITTNIFNIVSTTLIDGVTFLVTNSFTLTNNISLSVLNSNLVVNNIVNNYTNLTVIQLDNITSEIIYYVTGAVFSVQGTTGDVVFAVQATTSQVGYLEWSGTTLLVGTNTAGISGGGGIPQSPVTNTIDYAGQSFTNANNGHITNGLSVGNNHVITAPRSVGMGGGSGSSHTIASSDSLVAGANNSINTAGATAASILGGDQNQIIVANSLSSVIAGGTLNRITSSSASAGLPYSVIGGGFANRIGYGAGSPIGPSVVGLSIIGGGEGNLITNSAYSGIFVGISCLVSGTVNSVANGRRARALHSGSWVWGGNINADFSTTGTNQFLIRGSVGVDTNTLVAGASITVGRPYAIGTTIGITVTQRFLDASSNVRTNIYIGGILVAGYTE